jgi:hypothetical protein
MVRPVNSSEITNTDPTGLLHGNGVDPNAAEFENALQLAQMRPNEGMGFINDFN